MTLLSAHIRFLVRQACAFLFFAFAPRRHYILPELMKPDSAKIAVGKAEACTRSLPTTICFLLYRPAC